MVLEVVGVMALVVLVVFLEADGNDNGDIFVRLVAHSHFSICER